MNVQHVQATILVRLVRRDLTLTSKMKSVYQRKLRLWQSFQVDLKELFKLFIKKIGDHIILISIAGAGLFALTIKVIVNFILKKRVSRLHHMRLPEQPHEEINMSPRFTSDMNMISIEATD